MRRWLFLSLFCVSAGAGGAPAPDFADPQFHELLTVQKSVQACLPQVRSAIVAIETGDGTASGVLISEDGFLLTAAHVAEKPGRTLRVVLENGSAVKGVTLGLDRTTDAALMKMADTKKKWPHVKLARRVELAQPGEWCFALGHPGGFDKARGVVLRVGKIIKNSANALQTDCVLMGGDSGGALFNLTGELIGVHSQIWEGRDENMHVSMAPFLRSWDAMKAGKVITVWSTGCGGYIGIATEGRDSALEVVEVMSDSPAAKAGLRTGDFILCLDGEPVADQPQFSNAVRVRAAGDVLNLRVRSGSAEREVPITLASKPIEEG